MVLDKVVPDIRWFKGETQKCYIQAKMYRLYRKKIIFLYNLYIFVWIQHSCLAITVSVLDLDPSNRVIKR